MKLLALETSAGAASCAVTQDGRLLAEGFVNTRQTHSQTLMPMVQQALLQAELTVAELDGLAIAAGPGSFTGVRIGVAALKGLAFPNNTPCVGVSTLLCMAENFRELPGEFDICAVMDARCRQVYTAGFAAKNGEISRLTPDEALSMDTVLSRLSETDKPCVLVGDGAAMCYDAWRDARPGLYLAPEHLRFPRAAGVAAAAEPLFARGETVEAAALLPVYLRLPQAERELKARQAAGK
ncbi:MAG: tRNA (adenosine(37)-N6)-threonylcarbamoyltransferase complex dimerization subunit type 1 TsaB [Clostridia bacterium]|nr:tRNA (adenosine(37)-N6)-threonylcarbamoyltransferase complex dimerization subunit type 1 TsaB [Clostridia bacterium]